MRKPLIILGWCCALFLGAQTEPTLLWRIQPIAPGPASYLYGTVHSKDDRAFQFADSVMPAFERCTVVAGELDLATSAQGFALLERVSMADGKRLEDLYKKKDWKKVEEALVERLGIAAPAVYRLKPFFIVAMLTEGEMAGERSYVLDQYLQDRARAAGKRVIGVERVEEQLRAMDALPLKEQAAMLLEHLEQGDHSTQLEAMLDAYAAQDLDGLMKVADDAGGMPEDLGTALLTERNARMVHRMDSIIAGGEGVFFAIGAAHLPGETGLIQGLRDKGLIVHPVMSTARKPVPVEEER
ncbi:MAG: TraB/GumN family protein [Flavobacteriales bacterium]|nr:TraB/GumN family protein [Flavobacteriales bacterium]